MGEKKPVKTAKRGGAPEDKSPNDNTAPARRSARRQHGANPASNLDADMATNTPIDNRTEGATEAITGDGAEANTEKTPKLDRKQDRKDTERKTEKTTEGGTEPGAETTPSEALEDYIQSIKRYPSGWRFLERVEEAVSGIEDADEKDAARVELYQWLIDEAGRLDGKIAQTDEGQAARSRYDFAKDIFKDDPVLLKIKAGIEHLVLVQQEMIAQGLPPDALELLLVQLLIEQRAEALRSRLADKFPDPDLAVALFVALNAWSAGRLVEATIDRGRELTREEAAGVTRDSLARLRNLPAIVDRMMPDAFIDYFETEYSCGAEASIYTEPYARYCKFYLRRFNRRPPGVGRLNKMIVEEVRKSPGVPQTDYHTFYQGLTDERRRVLLDSRNRIRSKKADQKK